MGQSAACSSCCSGAGSKVVEETLLADAGPSPRGFAAGPKLEVKGPAGSRKWTDGDAAQAGISQPAAAALSDRNVRMLGGTGGTGDEAAEGDALRLGPAANSSTWSSPRSVAAKAKGNILDGLKDGSLDTLCKQAGSKADGEADGEAGEKPLSGLQWALRQSRADVKAEDEAWAREVAETLRQEPAWTKPMSGLEWARAQGRATYVPSQDDAELARELNSGLNDRYGDGAGRSNSSEPAPRLSSGPGLPRSMSGPSTRSDALGRHENHSSLLEQSSFDQIPEANEDESEETGKDKSVKSVNKQPRQSPGCWGRVARHR